MTGLQASIPLRSPSWNQTSDVDPAVGEAGVDATLKGLGKINENICEL